MAESHRSVAELAGARQRHRWGTVLGVSLVVAAAVVVPAWAWMSPPPGDAQEPGGYQVRMTDYRFSPNRMTWRVGERVTLTVVNESEPLPNNNHELMMGRQPNREPAVLGLAYPGGFAEDFFAGLTVALSRTAEVEMVMPAEAELAGPDAGAPFVMTDDMGGMDMGGMDMPGMEADHGFMVELRPGGAATLSFVVPDLTGTWEYGCFAQTGEHYANGMKGLVTIVR